MVDATFLAEVEAMSPDDFADLLLKVDDEQERALRAYLGGPRFERMRVLALKRQAARGTRATGADSRGAVVVLPGIMGSELACADRRGGQSRLWVQALQIASGRLGRLQLHEDGLHDLEPDYRIRATGLMKRYYGELLLGLAAHWDVRDFAYDWRKDVALAAAQLDAQIREWFGDDRPVHLVAHSMGGLVARTYIRLHRARWDAGAESSPARLVMLGTPNYGSYAIPQVLTGIEPMVRLLSLLDLRHDTRRLQATFNSFVGSYQMLPSPVQDQAADVLYRAQTYGAAPVSQRHLDAAREHHEELASVVDPDRMVYVAGSGQPTVAGLDGVDRLDHLDGYRYTFDGDGRVSHALGLLPGVPTRYVVAEHGDLASDPGVLAALDGLLTGTGTSLSEIAPQRGVRRHEDAKAAYERRMAEDEQALRELADRLRPRATLMATRGVETPAATNGHRSPSSSAQDERRAEDLLARGFLSTGRSDGPATGRPAAPPKITVDVVRGRIDRLGDLDEDVDVIAVGHYLRVRPQAALLALDRAISAELVSPDEAGRRTVPDRDLVLTSYVERGTLRGDLGQPFLLPDPRRQGRTIVVQGMGESGRLGLPELTVLVRELSWTVAQLGHRHLTTVLIGAGQGNLRVPEAVGAWLRGIRKTLSGLDLAQRRLERVTFVEVDADRAQALYDAVQAQATALRERHLLEVDLQPLKKAATPESEGPDEGDTKRTPERVPTRLTVGLSSGTYAFGALTGTAAVPERRIPLDPRLVEQANDELAGETDPLLQAERGQLLGRLLIPADLRVQLQGPEPVVLSLDATTARIHWELVARPELLGGLYKLEPAEAAQPAEVFLGASRGLTRQLRTAYAPPPEPPPPPQRVLRVLVVADPAADMPLAGAQEEGAVVAELFSAYNRVWASAGHRVEVETLLGPREATRTNVLRHLMLRSYDVLHFAGHCVYDRTDPAASGWLFGRRARLSAHELNRVDRVPGFVFSNACESGVTPDRSERRSVQLAPTFAEAFFGRGVANFVCTAWPVEDRPAMLFAVRLYEQLLGLTTKDGALRPASPVTMHEAMQVARLETAAVEGGARTWGAYQHYGNPYARFFPPAEDLGDGHESGQPGVSRRTIRPRRPRRQAETPLATAGEALDHPVRG